jgi:DNA-binding response OmpR family regulator
MQFTKGRILCTEDDVDTRELTEKLCQFDLKTPVLFYSGAAYETDREAARVSGAQGYLVKPANGDQLIAEVTRLIAESKPPHLSRFAA